jgi:hypothetical protein
MEREKGVRMGDVLDELRGIIVWDKVACLLHRTNGHLHDARRYWRSEIRVSHDFVFAGAKSFPLLPW